ncbi:hypothetical protein SRHO_G00004730 [Serrasalmus rhombeus]
MVQNPADLRVDTCSHSNTMHLSRCLGSAVSPCQKFGQAGRCLGMTGQSPTAKREAKRRHQQTSKISLVSEWLPASSKALNVPLVPLPCPL